MMPVFLTGYAVVMTIPLHKCKIRFLQMLGNRNIVQTIQSLSVMQFLIIINTTQDISGAEQESICLRYVDEDLVPHIGEWRLPRWLWMCF